LLYGDFKQFRQFLRDVRKISRFVPLSPVRNRGHIGAIGLQKDSVTRDFQKGLTQIFTLGKRYTPAYAQIKSKLQ
jgi:hypothetical protein